MSAPRLSIVTHHPDLEGLVGPAVAARGFEVHVVVVPRVDEALEQACREAQGTVVGVVLGGLDAPRRLGELADELRRGTRALIAVGLGMSSEDEGVLRAVARQHCLGLAADLDTLLDVGAILARGTLPAGPRLAILARTSAAAMEVERHANERGLSPATTRSLVRVDGEGTLAARRGADIVALAGPDLPPVRPRAGRGPLIVCACVPAGGPGAAGGPVRGALVQGGERLVRVLESLQGFATRSPVVVRAARPARVDRAAAHTVIEGPARTLSEPSSKRALAPYGVPFPREVLSKSASMAEQSARAMRPPLIAKIASPDLLDKLDGRGIVRGIPNAQQVRAAYHVLTRAAAMARADARILGVLLSETVAGIAEVSARIVRHPRLGLLLTLGGSGALRSVLPADPILLLPAARADFDRMVRTAPVAALYDGSGGRGAGDRKALVELLVRLAAFAHDFLGEVSDVLLDPIVVGARGEGVVATDARVTVG